MLRSLKEWKEFVIEKGSSGDMVFDILKDWEEASQPDVEADAEGCNACGFNKKFGTLNYCANCGKNLRTA